MNVAVVGTGYVGLVTGTCLANVGNQVICADKDPEVVEQLREAEIPIYEEGLESLVERNLEDDRLSFTTSTQEAVEHADVIFIAVGTPQSEDGAADLSAVRAVARDIGDSMEESKIVVCKSTVPVGTCDEVDSLIRDRTDHEVTVVSNPEFMKEGSAVEDFKSPDRIVIGTESDAAYETMRELYDPFMRRSKRFLRVGVRSAEMIKYASNAMLATKISFINEMANICEEVGADVEHVRRGMSLDERIGPHFIYPGVGFGGSCFPKDIRALERLGNESGARTEILRAVGAVNQHQKLALYRAAKQRYGDFDDRQFAVWGLSFKPGTDDIREAPSIKNIRRFLAEGANVRATDPEAIENAREALSDSAGDPGDIRFSEDDYEVLEGAEALFIFTEWEEFRLPNFELIKEKMETPVIFDGRNLYDPDKMAKRGIHYRCVGRP